MPYIDYFLSTDVEITKDRLTSDTSASLLVPDTSSITTTLDLGKDNRTWNKKQLNALKLILCNIVSYPHHDNGIFLYSRKKRQIPLRFNPSNIKYSSLFFVIDKLIESGILEGEKAKPRTKDNNPKKLSEFKVTTQVLNLAHSLGINSKTISTDAKFHVRLRDEHTKENLEFKYDDYSKHTEKLMYEYCHYLNQQNILLSTEDYNLDTGEGITDYGLRGLPIHLYRNYSNYYSNEDNRATMDSLFISTDNPNFCFGGRSGGLWQGAKKGDRPFILINGNKTDTADFPCSHLNLCYRQETNNWYQTETYQELKEDNRSMHDAYMLFPELHRDIGKQLTQMMFNIKGRSSVSRVFNEWLKKEAPDELVDAYKQSGYSNIQVMDMIEKKHHKIKDYFYKGKLAGQIIQWQEANLMHHLAMQFIEENDFTVLTVYDELIVEEQHQPMVKDFMFSSGSCELCDSLSLMNQIKNL